MEHRQQQPDCKQQTHKTNQFSEPLDLGTTEFAASGLQLTYSPSNFTTTVVSKMSSSELVGHAGAVAAKQSDSLSLTSFD